MVSFYWQHTLALITLSFKNNKKFHTKSGKKPTIRGLK